MAVHPRAPLAAALCLLATIAPLSLTLAREDAPVVSFRFYPPDALHVDADVRSHALDGALRVGNVSFVREPIDFVEPDGHVHAVFFSSELARRVTFHKSRIANRDAWRALRGQLEYRGEDGDGRRVYWAALDAPSREAVFDVFVQARAAERGTRPRAWRASAPLEVTCSNRIFCDGAERYVNGKCKPAHPATMPCVFGNGECFEHECLEETRTCAREPRAVKEGSQCARCNSKPKDFARRLASAATVRAAAAAVLAPIDGTCESPKPLFGSYRTERDEESFIVTFWNQTASTVTAMRNGTAPASATQVPVEGIRMRLIQKNTDGFTDLVRPSCSGGDGARDILYAFEVTAPLGQGFEVMMLGYDESAPQRFTPEMRDTLLAVHGGRSVACSSRGVEAPVDVLCSDDASLPGGTGSRVYGALPPGNYTLVASFFNDRAHGPYQLLVLFTDATSGPIRPVCTDRQCGLASVQVDGVQAECGLEPYLGLPACGGGAGDLVCLNGRCSLCAPAYVASPDYQPTCDARACGTDLCGQPCGNLSGGCPELSSPNSASVCEAFAGECVVVPRCNHLAPECPGGQQPGRWCGSDCQWHRRREQLVDLVAPSEDEVWPTISFNTRDFFLGSCPIAEGCVGVPPGVGPDENFQRKLMRFATWVHNIGEHFKPPPITSRPDLFMWSNCHEHFHFKGFAGFTLLNLDGTVALPGQKLAFCMLDSYAYLSGPSISCQGESDCFNQGIQRGWSDVYSSDLDCQWLDVTATPSAWYILRICVNFERTFAEDTFDNNCNAFPIWVPPHVDSTVKSYSSYFDGGLHSIARCQDLYERTAGALAMPIVCNGQYTPFANSSSSTMAAAALV